MWLADWQEWAALSVVGVTAGYLAWRGWRKIIHRSQAGCAAGCGACPATSEASSVGNISDPTSRRTEPAVVVGVGELIESARRR